MAAIICVKSLNCDQNIFILKIQYMYLYLSIFVQYSP